MHLGLTDAVVMVSGATGAIGEAVTAAFAMEGAQVAALHRGEETRLAPVRERIERGDGDPARVTSVEVDLTEPGSVLRAVATVIERFGRIDVLVNNAGVTLERPFLATNQDEVARLIDVNLMGTMSLTRAVLKPMLRQRAGSVVTISSLVGVRGGRGVSVYAATKAALNALTRALAIEMAPKGIRVNAIAPGLIETKMSARLVRRRGGQVMRRIPMARIGEPDEVATAAVWLASDSAASYITGQVLMVDGGLGL